MQTLWLILGSLLLPFVWGWFSQWLLARLWPVSQPLDIHPNAPQRSDPLTDYQI